MDEIIAEGWQSQPLILIVDDEKEARLLLRHILEREDFRVEEASGGIQAVAKAVDLRPDLIFMDIQMPGIDGFEVVKRLRAEPRTTRIPIIVVSAAAREPSDVARGLGLGADDYVRKPFNTSELVARARSNLRARQLEEHLQQRTEELEALIRIGSELNQELQLDELADQLIAAVLEQIPSTRAMLTLVTLDRHSTLIRCAGEGASSMECVLSTDSLPGYVLAHGEPAVINDLSADQRVSTIFDNADCVTGIAAPLKHGGQVLGVLALGDRESEHFTASDFRLLRSIAEQAALALRNAQLYTELRGYAQDLESMVEARSSALHSTQAQLMRTEKLAALGTLASGVAHEVNNPLQPLLTNLEMALEDIDAERPIDRELLEFAKEDVQRIQRIVSRLLEFARPGQSVVEPLNIGSLIHEVLMLANKQLEHSKVEVTSQLKATHAINGSADQLKQVFLNLIVNAMEAMPTGGRLTITTDEQENFLVLRVRDTGSGIRSDQLPKVFDPFFTTKSDGTGLGLSVSYGIIEGHGGHIEVESEPGSFTEFTIKLPIIET